MKTINAAAEKLRAEVSDHLGTEVAVYHIKGKMKRATKGYASVDPDIAIPVSSAELAHISLSDVVVDADGKAYYVSDHHRDGNRSHILHCKTPDGFTEMIEAAKSLLVITCR